MALSEPRSTATVDVQLTGSQIRLRALELAVQRYDGASREADAIVDYAKTLETYLTGPAPATSTSRITEMLSKDELEDWRIAIERLELNGSVKGDLDEQQRLYRIEYLASIIADTGDDVRARLDALVELKNTVQLIDGVPTPGTVNR